MDELPVEELRIVPTEKLREQIKQIGRRVVTEHGQALQILADHSVDPTAPHPQLGHP